MNVTDQFMMQQMQQMANAMANPPKTPASVKQEANETFQDLIQKKQQEVVQSEKEIVPDKKVPQQSGETAQKPANQEAAPQTPQQEPEKIQDQTLAETGYIPAEILLANQLVQTQPEIQVEEAQTAVPVVEAEQNPGMAVQPELPQETSVQEQGVPSQTAQQEPSSESFGAQLKQTAQPQRTQEGEAVQTQNQVRPESAEQVRSAEKPQEQEDVEILSAQEAPETPLFREVERAPVKVGEPEQLDTRQPDLDAQMTQKIQQALQQGAQQVEIRLTPENLGSLTIQMTRNVDGSLQVVLHTATEKALSLLSQHAEQMTVLLQGGGQPVQLEVRQSDEGQQAQQQNQQQQQQADADGRSQNQQRQPRQQHPQHNSQDFVQQMRLGLISSQEGV